MRESFLKYLEFEKRYSKHTLSAYSIDLTQFGTFLEINYPQVKLEAADHNAVRHWIIELVENDQDSRSVNRKIATLRSYYKFARKQGAITKDPTEKIRSLKTVKDLPSFILEDDMDRLLDHLSFGDHFEGHRDQLLIELLYGTGIRLTELINLKEQDINTHNNTIKVLGKRNKERIIPINKSLLASIKNYLKFKNAEFDSLQVDVLLVTDNGKKLYPMFVYRRVNHFLTLYTKSDKKSPHVLRHTFATHLLNKGAEMNAVKDLLGHSSLAATQVYTHNTLDKLKSVFDQAHPKAK